MFLFSLIFNISSVAIARHRKNFYLGQLDRDIERTSIWKQGFIESGKKQKMKKIILEDVVEPSKEKNQNQVSKVLILHLSSGADHVLNET